MRRPSREFKGESFELEGRLLLANGHTRIPGPAYVEFLGTSFSLAPTSTTTTRTTTTPTSTPITPMPTTPTTPTLTSPTLASPTTPITQVVGQQDRVATVILTRNENVGRLQVQVSTDPASPAVGVNVGAVDQTVTFANGQITAAVTVPILSGAPNPGEVDVNLTISPVDGSRQLVTTGPLELRIVASDATVPPRIVSTVGKPHGIVLTFSKPMNPVAASNVNNYAVEWTSAHPVNQFVSTWDWFFAPGEGLGAGTHGFVRLRSAEYDPATQSVTLIPKRKLTYTYSATTSIDVTQGHAGKTSGRPGQPSNLGLGLTDLDGNPINPELTPGKFSVYVFKGFSASL